MTPLYGALIKGSEVFMFYPIYHYLHKSQANNKTPVTNIYKGIQFQLFQSPLNRFVDLYLYENHGASLVSSVSSTIFKVSTYPFHTAEVYYQLNGKLPNRFKAYYKGFVPYSFINMSSYYIWFKSLEFYNKNIQFFENSHVRNGIVGFVSGLTVDILMHPLKTIKVNLQNNKFKVADLNMGYFRRGLLLKALLSSCQTAYFNIVYNIT